MKIINQLNEYLSNLTLKQIWENPKLIGDLTKINIMISDFLNIINTKHRPIFLRDNDKPVFLDNNKNES